MFYSYTCVCSTSTCINSLLWDKHNMCSTSRVTQYHLSDHVWPITYTSWERFNIDYVIQLLCLPVWLNPIIEVLNRIKNLYSLQECTLQSPSVSRELASTCAGCAVKWQENSVQEQLMSTPEQRVLHYLCWYICNGLNYLKSCIKLHIFDWVLHGYQQYSNCHISTILWSHRLQS